MSNESKEKQMELEIERLKVVASCAQGVLTGLNVGDIQNESPLHQKLRAVMIAYRSGKTAQEIEDAVPPPKPRGEK